MKTLKYKETPEKPTPAFLRVTRRLSTLFAIWIPLFCVVLLHSVSSAINATAGMNAAYEIVYRVSDALAILSFFASLSVLITQSFASDREGALGTFAKQAIGFLAISFFLQVLMELLLSALDLTPVSSFLHVYFYNYTFHQMTSDGLIYQAALISFLSVLTLLILLVLTVCETKLWQNHLKRRHIPTRFEDLRKTGNASPMRGAMASSIGLYLLYALVNQGVETYRMVYDLNYDGYTGAPSALSQYMTLFSPFLYIILYALAGYYVMHLVSGICTRALTEE